MQRKGATGQVKNVEHLHSTAYTIKATNGIELYIAQKLIKIDLKSNLSVS